MLFRSVPKDDRPTAASAMVTSFPTATEPVPSAAASTYDTRVDHTGLSASANAAVFNQKEAKPFVLGPQDFQMVISN